MLVLKPQPLRMGKFCTILPVVNVNINGTASVPRTVFQQLVLVWMMQVQKYVREI